MTKVFVFLLYVKFDAELTNAKQFVPKVKSHYCKLPNGQKNNIDLGKPK